MAPELRDREDQVQFAKKQFLDLAEELDREGLSSFAVYEAMQLGSHELFDLGWGMSAE